MARIPRITQQIFAGSAANNGQFGSGQLGTKVLSNSLTTIMGLGAWATGWLDAVLGASKFPPLEEFQAVEYVHSTQIAYLLQAGVAEYDAGTTYYIRNLVMDPATLQMYSSKTNANVGNPLTDTANWQLAADLSGGTRTRLTANATFYVATTGNDANPGTIGSPWLTLQHAIDYILNNLDQAGFTVTVNVSAGTYTGSSNVSQPFTGPVTFVGDAVTPSNVVINTTSQNCFNLSNGAVLNASGFKTITTTSGHHINTTTNSIFNIVGKWEFGAAAGAGSHILTGQGGEAVITASYTITGGAAAHFNAGTGGEIIMTGSGITLTGVPAFTEFVLASFGLISCFSGTTTFTGTSTGQKYNGALNAVINTAGGGINYFPGVGVGTVTTGAQYV